MKRASVIFSFFLLLAGCQHPSEVTLKPPDPDQELIVSSVVESDSTLQSASDSTGLIGADRIRFAGSLLVTDVKYDTDGTNITTVKAATAVLEDRTRPVISTTGKFLGYWGLYLGTGLRLNNQPMIPIPRKIAGVAAGWKYLGDLSAITVSNQHFHWSAPEDSLGAIGDSIDSPDNLVVLSPRGGSSFSRNNDLELRWRGQGSISIIIQSYDPSTKKAKPLLLVSPKINRGRVILDPKILSLLGRGKTFVFTFVLANRRELTVPRYSGTVLLQAASIYNSLVVIN